AITLAMLLAHTAGVKNFFEVKGFEELASRPRTLAELLAFIAAAPPDFAPGADFRYTNSGYALLAAVIERATGTSYGASLAKEISARGGMRAPVEASGAAIAELALGYAPEGADAVAPAKAFAPSVTVGSGSLVSTVDDLLAWDRAMQGSAVLGDAS